MLIRKPILEQIKLGEVTLAFRRWTRPNVMTGTLKTAVGVLVINLLKKQANEKSLRAMLIELAILGVTL